MQSPQNAEVEPRQALDTVEPGAEAEPEPETDLAAPLPLPHAELERRLDQHGAALHRDLLSLLEETRRAQEQEAARSLAHQRATAASERAAQARALEAATAQLARLQESFRRQTQMLGRSAWWRRELHVAQMAWRTWRAHVAMRQRVAKGAQAAAHHYDVGRLQQAVFRRWRAASQEGMRTKLKEQRAAAARAEAQCQELATAGQELAARLEAAEEQARATEAERQRLEQDMRKAFMRGVCALNIEAMAVMKRGLPPGAPNPLADVSNALPTAPAPAAAADIAVPAPPAQGPAANWLIAAQHSPASPVRLGTAGAAEPPVVPPAMAGAADSPGVSLLAKPPPEVPRPTIRVGPADERLSILQAPGGGPAAVRHSYPSATHRPATSIAVGSSLPNNVPADVAARFGSMTLPGSPRRAVAAPARRPGTAPQPPQQQQHVSQRSLAAQRAAAGRAPVVVRWGQGPGREQQ
eukprot:scaffold2.g7311.t1